MYVTQTTFEKVILQGAEIVQQSKSLLSWDINMHMLWFKYN